MNIDWTMVTTAIAMAVAKELLSVIIDLIMGKASERKKYDTKNVKSKSSKFDMRRVSGFIAFFMISYLLVDSIRSTDPLTRGAVFEIALFTFALGVLVLHKRKD
jgi:uncharacterized protein YqhQ